MVDAAIGGKTAINAAGIRNLVGTFREPEEIVVVPTLLETLPDREWRSGLVESLKAGFLRSGDLADLVVRSIDRSDCSRSILMTILIESIRIKQQIVSADHCDRGERRLLNFGHTVGHALEALQPGDFSHGEAVAFGMIAETLIAEELHDDPIDTARSAFFINRTLPFTAVGRYDNWQASDLLLPMMSDKKRRGSAIECVLPVGDSGWDGGREVDAAVVARATQRAQEIVRLYHAGPTDATDRLPENPQER